MVIAAIASLSLLLAEPPQIEYGPETTVISEPRREDGTIDYLAALNERFSDGVTPENNAAVDVLLTMGRGYFDDESESWYDEALSRLGVEHTSEAPVFVPLEDVERPEGVFKSTVRDALDAARKEPWTADEHPIVARWLEVNRDVLQVVEEASKKERFFVPLISPGETPQRVYAALLPHLAHIRRLAHALESRANLNLAADNVREAWHDVMTIRRLAWVLSDEETVISKLVAASLIGMTAEASKNVAGSDALTLPMAMELIALIREQPTLPAMTGAIDCAERYSCLDMAQNVDAAFRAAMQLRLEEVPHPVVQRMRAAYDPNRTMRTLNDQIDRLVRISAERDHRDLAQQLHAFDDELAERSGQTRRAFTTTNLARMPESDLRDLLSEVVSALILPSAAKALEIDRTLPVREDLLLLSLALGGHHAEHGRFPEDLEQLSPRFLDTIPRDRFNGQPLHYRMNDNLAIVWSVGPDLEDDDSDEEHDIVMTLKRP